jgi:hypothetical protein
METAVRPLIHVLEAWRSGHITTNEAMEMTGSRDPAALKALAERNGIVRRDVPERRRRTSRQVPAEGKPAKLR